jgi:hypothetical protein
VPEGIQPGDVFEVELAAPPGMAGEEEEEEGGEGQQQAEFGDGPDAQEDEMMLGEEGQEVEMEVVCPEGVGAGDAIVIGTAWEEEIEVVVPVRERARAPAEPPPPRSRHPEGRTSVCVIGSACLGGRTHCDPISR